MHNKKVLSEIDLGKYKKPNPYKDDIILSNEGQWKYPGEVTRIPSNEITMDNVPYMVWAQPNVGPGIMMEQGKDYYFDNADYVDEYPQIAKQGGTLKKNNTSRSIKATNKLFAQNYLFKKPGKKKIFDPNSNFYQEGGEFVEMELDDEDIELFRQGGYIVEDISVPQLTKAQEGKETGVESYTSWENAPEEYAPYVTNLKEANVVAEAAPWAKLSNEYEKKNSKEAFIESKKRDYLKKSNKGLNKMAGLSMDNFPKDVASNFADEYEYKKNNYVTKKLGKQKGFNPRKRDEWVEELSPGERKVVANSRYGNKLQPGYWNKALAGVQELGNTLLPGQPFQYNIPGLTKSEQKEMRDSSVSAVDILAPMDIPGAVAANYLKNNGLSTGSNFKNQPAVYSGERMANVDETDAMALSPLTYAGLQEIPASVYNAVKSTIKGTVKGAKALPGAIKTSKESGLLSNAYKINPLAVKENPNVLLHRVQKPGQTEEYIMKQYGKETVPGWARAFSSDISDMGYYTYPSVMKSRGYEETPEILRLKLPKKDIDKYNIYNFNANQKSQGLNPYAFGSNKPKDEFVLPIQDIIKAEKFGLEDIDNLYKEHKEFNTPHWLHGYKEVPKELPGSPNTYDNVQKAGFMNPLALADRVIPRLPTPGNYFGVEGSWNNLSPLNIIPGYGKKLSNTTDKLPVGFRKFGNSLDDVISSKTLKPKGGNRMGAKQIESEGNWAEQNKVNEAYNGVFEATMNPNIEGSNIKLQNMSNRNGILGTTKEGDVAIPLTDPGLSFNRRLPFSNKYVPINKQKLLDNKFQLATQLPHVQSLIEKYGIAAGHAAVFGYLYNGEKGAKENLKTINKYSVDPVINWSKKEWNSLKKVIDKKEEGGSTNDYIDTELTPEEIEWYKSQGYEIEELD
jgi:hypothetical protein